MNYMEYLQLMEIEECDCSKKEELTQESKMKFLVKDIVNYVLDEIENDETKIGVLLCEGDENSIDKAVYSSIFPNLVVLPVGSCTTIARLLYRVRKKLSTYRLFAYGIIDRDALSKSEIKRLFKEKGLNTTKLPFIENIICTPEVLTYVCKARGLEFEKVKKRIQDELIKTLWQQLKETLPINIAILKQERIDYILIQAATRGKRVKKVVNRNNILYAYRDKIIVSIVGSAVGIRHRKDYYEEIKKLLKNEEYREHIIKAMATYIPRLELYNLDDV